jgi:hypothetical protein
MGFFALTFDELDFFACYYSILQEGYVPSVCRASGSGGGESFSFSCHACSSCQLIWDSYRVLMMPLLMMQLPDYHDVIDHPMDFGTVRRKLARNVYRSFEQFEVRLLVFVVCSSTMRNIDSVLLFVGFLDSVVGDE